MRIVILLDENEYQQHVQRQRLYDQGEIEHPDPEAFNLAIRLFEAVIPTDQVSRDAGGVPIVELAAVRVGTLYALTGEV